MQASTLIPKAEDSEMALTNFVSKTMPTGEDPIVFTSSAFTIQVLRRLAADLDTLTLTTGGVSMDTPSNFIATGNSGRATNLQVVTFVWV